MRLFLWSYQASDNYFNSGSLAHIIIPGPFFCEDCHLVITTNYEGGEILKVEFTRNQSNSVDEISNGSEILSF